jgi:hypothetical protein
MPTHVALLAHLYRPIWAQAAAIRPLAMSWPAGGRGRRLDPGRTPVPHVHGAEDTLMDTIEILAIFLVWMTIIGAVLMWRAPGGGTRALVVPWLILSVVSIAVEFVVFFIVSYGLLFFVGKEAAAVGVITGAVAIAATPVAWGVILHRRAHEAARG